MHPLSRQKSTGEMVEWSITVVLKTTELVLVTGFCGGFTTFSTFMNENLLLGRDGAMLSAVLYTLLSLALGLIAVIAGYQIVK